MVPSFLKEILQLKEKNTGLGAPLVIILANRAIQPFPSGGCWVKTHNKSVTYGEAC